jgi:hypothetical protein
MIIGYNGDGCYVDVTMSAISSAAVSLLVSTAASCASKD